MSEVRCCWDVTQEQSGWSEEGPTGRDTSAVSVIEWGRWWQESLVSVPHTLASYCLSLASDRCFSHLSNVIGLWQWKGFEIEQVIWWEVWGGSELPTTGGIQQIG